jgi:hypothetical protein
VGKLEKFSLALMGVLAPGPAHARPSTQPPIDTRGIFSAQVSRGSKNFSQFQAILSYSKLILFYPECLFFGDLEPHAKFQDPTITPSVRKVTGRKKEEKIIPLIVDA